MKIAPSILDANFADIENELDSIRTADRIHLDIMDGWYVPASTAGKLYFNINPYAQSDQKPGHELTSIDFPIETEVHLMVDHPEKYFDFFAEQGCGTITFHAENTWGTSERLLQQIKDHGVKAGICIDGFTDIKLLSDEMINLADQILLMSVKAGKGGQSFMPEVIDKVKYLRQKGYQNEIEIDGGVNLENVEELKKAGADIVVVGSFLIKKPAEERAKVIEAFQKV